MTAKFFRLEAPEAPWGDYGRILRDGMTAHLGRDSDGVAQLERTGPFIPPISFPGIGDIIVVARLREQLQESGLTGLRFRAVNKTRVVRLEWEHWDVGADEPVEYPEGGGPEGYVLDRPHCPETAEALGSLWELDIDEGAVELRRKIRRSLLDIVLRRGPDSWWLGEICVSESSWDGSDFFRGTESRHNYVTRRARRWLEHHVPGSVAFTDVKVVP